MSNQQRRALAFFIRFRHSTPGAWDFIVNRPGMALYWSIFAMLATALVLFNPSPIAYFFLGCVFGAVLREVRLMLHSPRAWLWQRDLMNWEEIERRLASESADK